MRHILSNRGMAPMAALAAFLLLGLAVSVAQAQQSGQSVAATTGGSAGGAPALVIHCSDCWQCANNTIGCTANMNSGDGCPGETCSSCEPGEKTCGHAADLNELRDLITKRAHLAFLLGPAGISGAPTVNTSAEVIGGVTMADVSLDLPPAGIAPAMYADFRWALGRCAIPTIATSANDSAAAPAGEHELQ